MTGHARREHGYALTMSTPTFQFDTAAAILIGGGSTRMGSPKQHVLVHGVPMGKRVIAIAQDAGCHVVVSGPKDAMRGTPNITDLPRHAGHGPLAGIEAVLASGIASRWLILPCDMPHLTTASITRLLAAKADIAAFADPTDQSSALHLPLVVSTTMLEPLSAYLESGRRSIGGWLAGHSITLAEPLGQREAENINSV